MKESLLNPFLSLFLGLILFTSCQDDEIDSIFLRTDGGILTVLKDADGQPISDAKVALYNTRTENRIDVNYTDENGVVNFGRFEAGEYFIVTDFNHNDEYFQINEEVHIISGTDTQHEINVADHYGELLVRILDINTGQPIEFNTDAMIGLIPTDEAFSETTTADGLRDLIKYTYESESQLSITDLPQSSYLVVMYNEESIFYTNYATVDPYDKAYVNFNVNPMTLLLTSKATWVVSNITADSNIDNIMPISSISFGQNESMEVTYVNGDTVEAYFYMNSGGGFDWYNLGSSNYYFNFNEDNYEINSDGSITFNFYYWETYNNNDGTWYYSDNVSITLN
ncbi:hypothetical protein QYS49_33290 [Marivirga salinae]|uniref:Prealbumin-like fold domain-containing protein n=1 Tax=Marivirga salinarum TaxID=3059078 RepID=A0AA51NE46_9BACT|nr:hypothetical protein [Marivirga sp. BDSF4-3]WMN12340.1 hypothetical protein QYS49_33290 [Marivirga sp. BDSF4-3]